MTTEYLRLDRASDFRSEFVAGHMYPMSGGTHGHAALITGFIGEMRNALEGRPCTVTGSDLRLQIGPGTAYVYPDGMVLCGELPDLDEHRDRLANPSLVVEVLSPSTERYDRTDKFALYRRIASLRESVLVSQNEMRVEWYTRTDQQEWMYQDATGQDGVCTFSALGVTISLARLYRNVPGMDPQP